MLILALMGVRGQICHAPRWLVYRTKQRQLALLLLQPGECLHNGVHRLDEVDSFALSQVATLDPLGIPLLAHGHFALGLFDLVCK
jgi:hypothetical protein